MKPLARTLLWIAKAALLVVAIASLVLWHASNGAHSLWLRGVRHTVQPHRIDYTGLYAVAAQGRLILLSERIEYFAEPTVSHYRPQALARGTDWQWYTSAELSSWNPHIHPGLRAPLRTWAHDSPGPQWGTHNRGASVPFWLTSVTTAAWPLLSLALAMVRLVRRRRHPTGTCHVCGYDLRASPDRCPECGTLLSTS